MKKVKFFMVFAITATIFIINFASVSSTMDSNAFELSHLISMSSANAEENGNSFLVVTTVGTTSWIDPDTGLNCSFSWTRVTCPLLSNESCTPSYVQAPTECL